MEIYMVLSKSKHICKIKKKKIDNILSLQILGHGEIIIYIRTGKSQLCKRKSKHCVLKVQKSGHKRYIKKKHPKITI